MSTQPDCDALFSAAIAAMSACGSPMALPAAPAQTTTGPAATIPVKREPFPVARGVPPLLVAAPEPGGVWRVEAGRRTRLVAATTREFVAAYPLPGAQLAVAFYPSAPRYGAAQFGTLENGRIVVSPTTSTADAQRLVAAGDWRGRAVLALHRVGAPRVEADGRLALFDVANRPVTVLAAIPRIEVTAVSWSHDLFAISTLSGDYVGGLHYRSLGGAAIPPVPKIASPFWGARLSPDGRRLAYLAGPTLDVSSPRRTEPWEIGIIDVASGRVVRRVEIGGPDRLFGDLTYDGRWIAVSRSAYSSLTNRATPLPIVVVDTGVATLEPAEMRGISGAPTFA